jgi:hypothetical protein
MATNEEKHAELVLDAHLVRRAADRLIEGIVNGRQLVDPYYCDPNDPRGPTGVVGPPGPAYPRVFIGKDWRQGEYEVVFSRGEESYFFSPRSTPMRTDHIEENMDFRLSQGVLVELKHEDVVRRLFEARM